MLIKRVAEISITFFFLFALACGGDDEDVGPDADPDNGNGVDADPDNGNGVDAGPGNGENGENGDSWEDEDCPVYHIECDGECIPGVSDPDNCGGCGVTCEEGEICSGGECADEESAAGECPQTEDSDIEVCDRRCADLNWDDENCGECGEECGDGQSCAFGNCVDAIGSDEELEGCEDGGPPIDFFPPDENGDNGDDGDLCAGGVAERTFRFGLCSCEGVDLNHRIFVDGFESSRGAYEPGGPGGGIGANENVVTTTTDETLTATGVLWSAGEGTLEINHNSQVDQHLYCGGDLSLSNTLEVGADGEVVGDITGGGNANFGETLTVRPDSDFDENRVSFDELVEDGDLEIEEACTECDEDDQVPVEEIVEAREDDNDNDRLDDFDRDVLDNPGGDDIRVDLPCGNYYLDEVDVGPGQNVVIVAHGRTALYVGGDVSFDHPVIIVPADGAELDVLVAGDVEFSGQPTQLGTPTAPALFRMYVGGEGGINPSHRVGIGGYLYAVPGGYNQESQRVRAFGGIYTQDYATGNQVTEISFDRRVLDVGEDCEENGDDDDDRCVPLGDSCEADADCCTPLECISGECREPIVIE